MTVTFSEEFLAESISLIASLDVEAIEATALGLADVRAQGGRLFILGVGGSAGHASHAVNDFRKICGFEAYAPTDNVSELTARTNDEGWDSTFVEWLRGDASKGVSGNIVRAIDLAVEVGADVFGVVGRDGGHTARQATACVIVPPQFPNRVTPHTEGLCAVIWHLLVSHPALAQTPTKWESI
jgi:D-sedoheptulose 7-phosphate isomerase